MSSQKQKELRRYHDDNRVGLEDGPLQPELATIVFPNPSGTKSFLCLLPALSDDRFYPFHFLIPCGYLTVVFVVCKNDPAAFFLCSSIPSFSILLLPRMVALPCLEHIRFLCCFCILACFYFLGRLLDGVIDTNIMTEYHFLVLISPSFAFLLTRDITSGSLILQSRPGPSFEQLPWYVSIGFGLKGERMLKRVGCRMAGMAFSNPSSSSVWWSIFSSPIIQRREDIDVVVSQMRGGHGPVIINLRKKFPSPSVR